MRTINVGPGMLAVSEISLGCMRIHALEPAALDKLLGSALDAGIPGPTFIVRMCPR